ncbi:MAG TPA: hypothetical protein ACFYDZ_07615, partial [Candidatus Brocadiaceae bacterium]
CITLYYVYHGLLRNYIKLGFVLHGKTTFYCSADPLWSANGGGLRRELSRTINPRATICIEIPVHQIKPSVTFKDTFQTDGHPLHPRQRGTDGCPPQ